jgi:AraC-like DNA-binding protein
LAKAELSRDQLSQEDVGISGGPEQIMRFAPGRAFVRCAWRIDSNHDVRRSVDANRAAPRDLRGHYFRDRAKRHCGFRDAVPDQLAAVSQIVSTIAQEIGLTDQSHLTSIFHREMGATPSGYRAEVG